MSRTFGEGGNSFLKRALLAFFETGHPVTLNIGNAYAQYKMGRYERYFSEGLTLTAENGDYAAVRGLMRVASGYDTHQAIAEIFAENPELWQRTLKRGAMQGLEAFWIG